MTVCDFRMLEYILEAILLLLGSWLLYWYYKVQHFENYLKFIPGPTPLPLVGNAWEFSSSKVQIPVLMKYLEKFNGNFKIYIGAQPYIVLTETKDLEFLLTSSTILKKADAYRFLHNWLNSGLLTGSGNKWKKHRKIITPTFHFKILEEFVDVFNSASDILVKKLNKVSNKTCVDIYSFVNLCTLDIICETAMGTCVNAQDDFDSEYVKSVHTLSKVLTKRGFSPFLSIDFLYRFTKTYQEEQHALKVVHNYSKSVITRRKAELLKTQNNQTIDTTGRQKKKAFLDLLLEYSSADPSFTNEDICQEVDTFIFAGHDTTGTSISFALFSLANNPEVQIKAYNELESIFSDNPKRSATYQDLQEMRYLELVIKESLRIYSTVPFFGRVTENDVEWNGKIIPKGVAVYPFPYGVHRSKVHIDPEKFNPERFRPENVRGKSPFIYFPFSAGIRNCLGQRYAMLEMKTVLSTLLRNFEFSPTVPEHKLILKSEVLIKSDNGFVIQFKKRH